ncbi:hypothetical protein K2173_002033 [Erythroxylum novogranatense]|uniref:Ubiquitin-like domain-containing protein n=1 Tax=Erythroxylum novogranatense TaxID=1862640 RepID=A0AAV8SPG4_9ROSI|nr:hypothetical protein K2173_002033 [Erythroxylum novogranatense]
MFVVLNARFETKVRVECQPNTTIKELKEKASSQTGTPCDKMKIRKWWMTLEDDKTLQQYRVGDGDGLDLYTYN